MSTLPTWPARFGANTAARRGDYVRRLRVEYASRLLLSGDTPIGVIAHSAGFADQSHFSKTFRRLAGQTPAGFRAASHSLTKKVILVQDE